MNVAIRFVMLYVVALAVVNAALCSQVSAVPVTTGLSLRYDGTNVTTISGNQVASWNNQGSLGIQGNVAPRLTTARPTVLVNSLNSQSVINFAGQNQEVLKSSNFSSQLSQPNTLFIVVNDTANNSPVIFDGVNATDRNFFRPQAGGTYH